MTNSPIIYFHNKYHDLYSMSMALSIDYVKTHLEKIERGRATRLPLDIATYVFTNYDLNLVPNDDEIDEQSATKDGIILASIMNECKDNCAKYFKHIEKVLLLKKDTVITELNASIFDAVNRELYEKQIPRFFKYHAKVLEKYNANVTTEKYKIIITNPTTGGKKRKTKKYRMKKRKTHRRKY